MTESEAGAIYNVLLDYASSIDEHITFDDVVAGLVDLIEEIERGDYTE